MFSIFECDIVFINIQHALNHLSLLLSSLALNTITTTTTTNMFLFNSIEKCTNNKGLIHIAAKLDK